MPDKSVRKPWLDTWWVLVDAFWGVVFIATLVIWLMRWGHWPAIAPVQPWKRQTPPHRVGGRGRVSMTAWRGCDVDADALGRSVLRHAMQRGAWVASQPSATVTWLFPALRQSVPVSRSDPVAVPRSSPNRKSGLAVTVGGTSHPGSKLRIAQPACALVTRVRRHRPPPVRALRFQLCYQSGNVAARPFTLFALGHRQARKAARRGDYCSC